MDTLSHRYTWPMQRDSKYIEFIWPHYVLQSNSEFGWFVIFCILWS